MLHFPLSSCAGRCRATARTARPSLRRATSKVTTTSLAWEINSGTDPTIVEKNAGLNNTSGYLGMIRAKRIGLVILTNRGNQNPAEVGRRLLSELAQRMP